jgi:hypothetical protein
MLFCSIEARDVVNLAEAGGLKLLNEWLGVVDDVVCA